MTTTNKRELARANELEVLKAIALTGWLTTRLVGAWVWQNSGGHSANVMAERTLKRLEKRGEVIRRDTPANVDAWILTKPGAARLNAKILEDGYARGWAHHGYEVGFLDFIRHVKAAEYLIEQKRKPENLGVIGRAGIRARIVDKDLNGLDGLIIRGDYTLTGILVITNSGEAIQQKARTLAKNLNELIFVGDKNITRHILQKLKR